MAGSFDIGRVLSRGFQTIGNQFVTFVVLGFLFAGLPGALFSWFLPTAGSPEQAVAAFTNPWFWVSFLALVPFSFLLQAALVRASILDLRSEPVELGPILGQSLLLLLPMIGLSIVTVIGVGLGMVLFIVPGIILYIMWIVAVPALVEERRGIFGSLSRSAELTKGARWWIFLLLVLYLIASSLISGLVGTATLATGGAPLGAFNIILTLVINVINGVVAAAMLASLYIELRMNKEGGTGDSLAMIFA